MSNQKPTFNTVTEYVKAARSASDVDNAKLLELILAESENLRDELKMAAEVELDEHMNFKPKSLAGLYRIGSMFANSEQVPAHYRGKPADCAIGAQMALRLGVDILAFLQSSYIVHGTPGIKGTLAIALIHGSGKIKGRLKYTFSGTIQNGDRSCTCSAIDADSGEIVSATVDWQMVKAEGWDKPKGTQTSKWLTLPDQMFKYRSAMFLGRSNFPDVLLGFYTDDELEDIHGVPATDSVTGMPSSSASKPVSTAAIDRTRSQLDELLDRQAETVEPTKDSQETTTDSGDDHSEPQQVVPEKDADAPPAQPTNGGNGKKTQAKML